MNEIREVILKKFKTQSAFAEALGWTRQKISRIAVGREEPTALECSQMMAAMGDAGDDLLEALLKTYSKNQKGGPEDDSAPAGN